MNDLSTSALDDADRDAPKQVPADRALRLVHTRALWRETRDASTAIRDVLDAYDETEALGLDTDEVTHRESADLLKALHTLEQMAARLRNYVRTFEG